jgi:GLPGLI family protein
MKLRIYFFTFLFAILSYNGTAQSTHVIEPSVLEVTYKTDCKYGLAKGCNEDVYTLRCGKNVSEYINQFTLWFDSLSCSSDPILQDIPLQRFEDSFKQSSSPSKQIPKSPGKLEYLYNNLEKGKISVYTGIMGSHYRILEEIPKFKWQLSENTTKNIIGYDCMMATTTFRGRQWTAWYTMDIPLSLGPWKFGGLPGLILLVECKDFISIEAVGLKTKGLAPVTFYNFHNYKFENIDRVKYLRIKTNSSTYPKGTKMTPTMELE